MVLHFVASTAVAVGLKIILKNGRITWAMLFALGHCKKLHLESNLFLSTATASMLPNLPFPFGLIIRENRWGRLAPPISLVNIRAPYTR